MNSLKFLNFLNLYAYNKHKKIIEVPLKIEKTYNKTNKTYLYQDALQWTEEIDLLLKKWTDIMNNRILIAYLYSTPLYYVCLKRNNLKKNNKNKI